jgi:hypothetical protein
MWARERSANPNLLAIPKPSEDRTWAKLEQSAESIISALGPLAIESDGIESGPTI